MKIGLLDSLKISQNQGFLYEKKRAVHFLNTLKIYIQYIDKFMQMPFLKFICTNLQRKHSYGPFFDKYCSGGRSC